MDTHAQGHIDGALMLQWAQSAAAALRVRQAEINSLNVFPIPDSDTGTNMALTMEGAVESARSVGLGEDAPVKDVALAVAQGAVRSARGNSGLVLSQVFRAIAQESSTSGVLDAASVPLMLNRAWECAQAAISNPVEGTVISVIAAAARGAEDACGGGEQSGLVEVLEAACTAAERALEQTPHQLAVLADNGVVDAGGKGFLIVLRALLAVARGELSSPFSDVEDGADQRTLQQSDQHPIVQQIEVMFHFAIHEPTNRWLNDVSDGMDGVANGSSVSRQDESEQVESGRDSAEDSPEDSGEANREDSGAADVIADVRQELERVGDSVVVGHISDAEATMHVHVAVDKAGSLIEYAFRRGVVSNLRLEALPPTQQHADTAGFVLPVIAVCPANQSQRGVRDLFERLGAQTVISGLKGSQAVARTQGPTLVLMNGQDVSALRDSTTNSELEFVETFTVVGGLAAMAVFDPEADWEDTIDDILAAVSTQRVCEPSVDDVETDSRRIAAELVDGGGELITILWEGDSRVENCVGALVTSLGQVQSEVEVQVIPASGLGTPIQVGVE